MSYNDILFSRGPSNATIVASGNKIAVGVVSNPLLSTFANVDFQIFGNRGLLIPVAAAALVPSIAGIVRFNDVVKRLEIDTGTSIDQFAVKGDLLSTQLTYVGGTTYVIDKNVAVVPFTPSPGAVSVISVALDIQDAAPKAVLRNLNTATGNSSIYIMGGTGNANPSAVNGYEFKVNTENSLYGTSLEVNPIIKGNLNTTLKSITLTSEGIEINPAILSIGTPTIPTLKITGSAHTTHEALKVDKQFVSGLISVFNDSNKIASFSYNTADIVLDVLATSKVQINGATGGVLAVRAIDNGINPGYIAKFSQGGLAGTTLEGIEVAISNSTAGGVIAVFRSGTSAISVAKIDGTGNIFGRGLFAATTLSVGGNSVLTGNLSVIGNVGITSNLSVIGNVGITSNLSVIGNVGITSNLSVIGNVGITSNLSVIGNLGVSTAAIIQSLSIPANLTVAGTTAVANISVLGTIFAQNYQGININTTSATFNSIRVTGATDFGSISYTDLEVSGNLSVGGNVIFPAVLSAANLIVSGSTLLEKTGDTIGAAINTRFARAGPSSVVLDDVIFGIYNKSYNNASVYSTNDVASIVVKATQNHTTVAAGTKMEFSTTANGTITPSVAMVIDHSGNVGIGTTGPTRKLHVNGLAKALNLPSRTFYAYIDRSTLTYTIYINTISDTVSFSWDVSAGSITNIDFGNSGTSAYGNFSLDFNNTVILATPYQDISSGGRSINVSFHPNPVLYPNMIQVSTLVSYDPSGPTSIPYYLMVLYFD